MQNLFAYVLKKTYFLLSFLIIRLRMYFIIDQMICYEIGFGQINGSYKRHGM